MRGFFSTRGNFHMEKTARIFSNKTHGLEKKFYRKEIFFFRVDYVKIIESHVVHT